MKNTALIVPLAMIPLLLGSAGQLHAQTPSAAKAPPTTASGADPAPAATPEQISYMFGLLFGTQLHSSGVSTELSPDTIAAARFFAAEASMMVCMYAWICC